MRARARPSSMIAAMIRSRSIRSSGLCCDHHAAVPTTLNHDKVVALPARVHARFQHLLGQTGKTSPRRTDLAVPNPVTADRILPGLERDRIGTCESTL